MIPKTKQENLVFILPQENTTKENSRVGILSLFAASNELSNPTVILFREFLKVEAKLRAKVRIFFKSENFKKCF